MGVSYERKDRIAYITIEGRTEYNFYAPDTVYLPFYDALVQYREDPEAWCAVVTAVGTKAFSAGGDLKAYEQLEEGYGREVGQMLRGEVRGRSLDTLIRGELKIMKPIIFAVNGLCLGAALAFVVNYSDITIAVPHARFGLPEIKWAVGPGIGASRLQRFLPWPIAMELYLTGRLMDAEEAYKYGFINRVVPPDELMSVATDIAQQICDMPPLHIRTAKEVLIADRMNSLLPSLQLERFVGADLRDHPDTKEGIRAFVEKRKPRYTGKTVEEFRDLKLPPSEAGKEG